MKSSFSLIGLLVLILILPAMNSFSQDAGDSVRFWAIDTRDGNTFIGSIEMEDSSRIVLLTELYGQLSIPKDLIKEKKVFLRTDLVEGEYWFSNPHATRYFFMTSAYGLEKGEGYYQNTWILFNQVNYGITNFLSLGGGLVPLFLFAGSETPVFISPKLTFPLIKEKVNLGGGLLLGHILGESGTFGLAYGALTFGSRDKNLTLGTGWAFVEGDWAEVPTLTLSGMIRVSRKTYLLSENYYIGTSGGSSFGIISMGGRSVQKRLAIDYGLVLPIGADIGSFIAIPWLGIAVPFGKTR